MQRVNRSKIEGNNQKIEGGTGKDQEEEYVTGGFCGSSKGSRDPETWAGCARHVQAYWSCDWLTAL